MAKWKNIGQPKGKKLDNLMKVKTALEKELFIAGTVKLTRISVSSVKSYRKELYLD
jgi:hypothetical protein